MRRVNKLDQIVGGLLYYFGIVRGEYMAIYKTRSQQVQHTEIARLNFSFKDGYGNAIQLDTLPFVSIIQSNGNVSLPPTTMGVSQLSLGIYQYDYQIGYSSPIGVYIDRWAGIYNDQSVYGEGMFIVFDSDLPAPPNSDGYLSLGDDVGFDYSQNAIRNINSLLKTLRARMSSSGKAQSVDANGNKIYITCDIFSVDMLVSALADTISRFNELPFFTAFHFEDTEFVSMFHHILVQGATLQLLASKSLLERGKEYTVSDQGISFLPPTVSELMSTQWSGELSNYTETLTRIKLNMRPAPTGLGTMSISSTGGANSVVKSLRWRRERQVF